MESKKIFNFFHFHIAYVFLNSNLWGGGGVYIDYMYKLDLI